MPDIDVDPPFRSEGMSQDEWKQRMEVLQALRLEQSRRNVHMLPTYYGLPDLLFPKGRFPGQFNHDTMKIRRKKLPYEETDEQYEARRDKALIDFVTKKLFIVKDDKLISIVLTPSMEKLLCDLFYYRTKKVILWANRGGGKCLGRDTLVIRADGSLAKVQDIKVGDQLMGPDSQPRTVLSTTTGRGPLYKIRPIKGDPWVCNDKHVLTLVKHGHQNGGGEVIDIAVDKFLAQDKTFQQSYKLFTKGVDQFFNDLPAPAVDPYFLGVWFGDGTKTMKTLASGGEVLSGVAITKADPEIRTLCHETAADWGLAVREKANTSDCPTYILASPRGQPNPLLEVLRGAVGPELAIPDAVLRGSRQTRLEFLAGFIDTDGELHHSKSGFVITQKREDWARAVWWIARSLGLYAGLKTRQARSQDGAGGTYYVVQIYGDVDQIPNRIARKKAKPRAQRKDPTRTGFSIEQLGEGDYYGFMLDGDCRFLLGDFTVTHNSLLAAIFIWLMLVYRKRSCINMGGAGNQARRVYDYTTQFWANTPGLQQGMLDGDPLMERTLMKNGTKLICATSKSSAIGEHIPLFVADEACTDRPGGDVALMRSLQGCLSEDDPMVFLLSTFHLPTGFFAEMWDNAEKQGFQRYKWDAFETMKRCTEGLDTATEDDPEALEYCKTQCPLSWQEAQRNEAMEVVGYEYVGCVGKARHSRGWIGRDKVLEAQRINAGTRIFPVEHACIRPRIEGSIYDPAVIDRCVTPGFFLMVDRPKVVGIDWGLTECALVLVGEWRAYDPDDPTGEEFVEGVGVIDVVFMHGKTVAAVVEHLQRWQLLYGDELYVRSDASHPYANRDLYSTYGYRVRAVSGDKGDQGKDNVARWMASGLFRIMEGFPVFVEQLKNLRRDLGTGKQVKDNKKEIEGDHGPDALRFALMNYDFIKWAKKRGLFSADPKKSPSYAGLAVDSARTSRKPTAPREQRRPRRPQRPNRRPGRQQRPGWRGRGLDSFLGGVGGGGFSV